MARQRLVRAWLAGCVAALALVLTERQTAAQTIYDYNAGKSTSVSLNPGYDILRNNTYLRPTVSPYLQLAQPGINPGTTYFTQVRPQLDQQRVNQENAARLTQLQQQVNQAIQSPYRNRGGDERLRGTGHQTGFLNLSHYYNYNPAQLNRR